MNIPSSGRYDELGATFVEASIAVVIVLAVLGTGIDITLAMYRRALAIDHLTTAAESAGSIESADVVSDNTLENEILQRFEQLNAELRVTPGTVTNVEVRTYNLCAHPDIQTLSNVAAIGPEVSLRTILLSAELNIPCVMCIGWGMHKLSLTTEVPLRRVSQDAASCS